MRELLVFAGLSAMALAAIVLFLVHWVSPEDVAAQPVVYATLTLVLCVLIANHQGRWYYLLLMRHPVPMAPRSNPRVAVVTAFVAGIEPIEMLRDSVGAMLALKGAPDVWVLDEMNDERVVALCRELGARHFSRLPLPQYQAPSGTFQSASKHGNYNAWLHALGFAAYDVVSAFDVDHVPDAGFLSRTLGYFEDPAVGYVQVPQAYYNQSASFIARGAAEETYSFYSGIQLANFGLGHPLVIGCHNTHRTKALREIGGFGAHDADDLLVTLHYNRAGWRGVYVPEIMARGIAPVDWDGYLTQQRRWARSVIDVRFRVWPALTGKLEVGSRIVTFLHGLGYLHRSLCILALVLVCGQILWTRRAPSVLAEDLLGPAVLLACALGACELFRQRFYLEPRTERGIHWRACILQAAKWPYFLMAFADVFVGRRIGYVTTRKTADKQRRVLILPHAVVALSVVSTWATGILLHGFRPQVLDGIAAFVVVASLALIASAFLRFPAPYDAELRHSFLCSREGT